MTDLPAEWRDAIKARLDTQPRVILGLAGTPGAGKSSLAEAIANAFGGMAIVVPMDGFHLANVQLAALGRADRKGAPDTFDSDGYAALLRRIGQNPTATIYAPAFRREIEEPIAGAIAVTPAHRLIVTEGNYLLEWAEIRPLLDICWFVDIDPAERVSRLIARHQAFGRSAAEAREWVLRSDEANARQIERSRGRADRILCWPPQA